MNPIANTIFEISFQAFLWALEAAYSVTLYPHDVYHRTVTHKYGPDAKEKWAVLPERFRSKTRPRLWVHGVSVGETIAARSIVRAFKAQYPGWDVVFTTTTATGREVAQKQYGAENVFYFPLDFTSSVRRALDTIRPDAIILMELEVWPHFLQETRRREIPVMVANVRITERSMRRFRLLKPLARRMLRQVTCWCSQSEAYSNCLRELGVEDARIHTVGSVKYDGLDLSEKPDETVRLRGELGGAGRLFVAGSTHAGEEETILALFAEIRAAHPDVRLVLVPRHPERCAAVEALIPAAYRVHRRSAGAAPAGTDIILGDTMGELANLYRAADIVFVGGSFNDTGGHNMLEPAAFAKPILYGPCVFNFLEPAEALEREQAALRLPEPAAEPFIRLLSNPAEATAMGARAKAVVASMQGATARTMDILKPILDGVKPSN